MLSPHSAKIPGSVPGLEEELSVWTLSSSSMFSLCWGDCPPTVQEYESVFLCVSAKAQGWAMPHTQRDRLRPHHLERN